MTSVHYSNGLVQSMERVNAPKAQHKSFQQITQSLESLIDEHNALNQLVTSLEQWDDLIQTQHLDKHTVKAIEIGLEHLGNITYQQAPSLESLEPSNESLADVAKRIKYKAKSFNKKIKEALKQFFSAFNRSFLSINKEAKKLLKEIDYVDFKEDKLKASDYQQLVLDGEVSPTKVLNKTSMFITQFVIDAKWRQPWTELDKLIEEKVNNLKKDAKVSDLITILKELEKERKRLFDSSQLKETEFKVNDATTLGFELKGSKVKMSKKKTSVQVTSEVNTLTKGQAISTLEKIIEQTDKVTQQNLEDNYTRLIKDSELVVSNEDLESTYSQSYTPLTKTEELVDSTKRLVKSFLSFVMGNMIQTAIIVSVLSQMGGLNLASFLALFTTGFTISIKVPGIFAICLLTAIIFGYINRNKIIAEAVNISNEALNEKDESKFKTDLDTVDQEARNKANEIIKDVYKNAESTLTAIYRETFKMIRASY